MDQIVVHLSINHTTLPDIHNVLSSLHTGGMSTHMGASRGPTCEARDKAIKVGQDHLNEDKVDEPSDKFSYKSFAWDMASTSEERLWQQDIELSTITRPGKGEVEQGNVEQGRPAATSSSSMRVIVQTDIRIRYEDIT
ncbi:hypothetical protein AA0121_g13430 [Alternaria tenuissima]|jgi:hypothetical protein|nr:hypothetical protein AA0121_g13430 [Alternaria tenuissima]